jgi:xylulokinase
VPPLVLGIDLGSTGTKVSLLDVAKGFVASRSAPSPLFSDHPGWAEADTQLWWDNVCALLPALAEDAGASPSDIDAVATTGMVPAVVPLGRDRRPLRRAILQNDARATQEIAELNAELGALGYDMIAETGSALTQQSVAPTWRWLQRNEPAIAEGTSVLVGSYDWLAIALGAEVHVEENWAIESGLFRLDGSHAEAVLAAARLPSALCAPRRRPGQLVGRVSGAGLSTSLAEGTPIYVGGADHVLAAYAAGLAKPGDWLVKLGGAGDVLVVSDRPVVDRRWYLDAHPMRGLWLPNGCMATSGGLLRWAQELFGGVPLEELDQEAAEAAPAAIVSLPYFLGEKSPLHDPDMRGAVVGLHLAHGRGDVFRSFMEAVAYGFRQHFDIFTEAGLPVGEGRVSNGGSRSSLWKQIVADVLGHPLHPLLDHGGAAYGAALVAAAGAGHLTSFADAARFVRLGEPIAPTQEHREAYDEGYRIYLELQERLAPLVHRLVTLGRRTAQRQSPPPSGAPTPGR